MRLRRYLDDGIDPRRAESRRRVPAVPRALSAAVVGNEHAIEALAQEFIERWVRPSRKRPEYAEAILARDVLSEWKGRDARTIKPREVIQLLDKIVARGSPVSANRTAALLTQLFKFGVHRAIVETSPVQLLMRPGGKEKPRSRALGEEELKAFLAHPIAATRYPRLAHVLQILLLTGQRRGELAAARWRDVDLKARTWKIPPEISKTGREHVVPLSSWAIEEFKQLKKAAGRSAWVLPARDPLQHIEPKLLTRGVAKCTQRFKELQIAEFTLHDLRRTCRTGLAKLGIEPHIGELVLGHSLGKIHGTYDTHSYLSEQRTALERWAAQLETLRARQRQS